MEKITTVRLSEFKKQGRRIAALTSYDAPFARIMDGVGIDIVLVGDSVGMTALGRPDTLSVTMDEMIHHARAVASAVQHALVVVDMPFMSFQVSPMAAVENAGRLIKETGAQAVKLEGGEQIVPTISAIIRAGIPVMGHVGLTPQSIHQLGGFKMQGGKSDDARRIMDDAIATQKAGAFAVVIEAVPLDLAQKITETLLIPTIGIGAGMYCDGQILVLNDLLGLTQSDTPRFVKKYANIAETAKKAFGEYIEEVRQGAFPANEHCYHSKRPPTLKVVGDDTGRKGL